MKLYLSSYGLGNQPDVFRELIGVNKRVAVVLNALDLALPADRSERLAREFNNIRGLGLEPQELDLRAYFDKPRALAKRLQHFGAVWVRGGNVFVLRRAMAQSGFDKMAEPLLRSEQLVYGGFSAGSCIVVESLHGIELVDDPHEVPPGYGKRVIWSGLGWVDFSIAPHYRSNHRESAAIEEVVAYWKQSGNRFKALRDGQAIVIEGEIQRLLK